MASCASNTLGATSKNPPIGFLGLINIRSSDYWQFKIQERSNGKARSSSGSSRPYPVYSFCSEPKSLSSFVVCLVFTLSPLLVVFLRQLLWQILVSAMIYWPGNTEHTFGQSSRHNELCGGVRLTVLRSLLQQSLTTLSKRT